MSDGTKARGAVAGNRKRQAAIPGRGGLRRIAEASLNSLRGLKNALGTEAAVQQEVAVLALGVPLAFFVASDAWTWLALVGSLLFVLTVELLNTAVERLCNHVTPERHEAIRVTKDIASAGVFFSLVLAGLVWSVAILQRLGWIG
ncbi:diacylglycerol kinase [Afifella pfennigii]|uniref:diacylglycerol kinase n=1 Tax=Afifella pfennigii TaxID=209897 RepID=UPI000A019E2B|nr:diacylglycerol kinase [Afifella pfennigii]